MGISLRIEVVDRNAGGEQRHTVLAFVERELTMETLGMSLNEGKTLLATVRLSSWRNRCGRSGAASSVSAVLPPIRE